MQLQNNSLLSRALLSRAIALAIVGAWPAIGIAQVTQTDGRSPNGGSDTAPVAIPASPSLDAETGADSGATLDTITVTAQKREETTQRVPLAITAIGAADLAAADIGTSGDIQRRVPNFSGDSSSGRSSKPRWFIRGIGSNDPSVNLESPVGIYVDDVYLGIASSQNFPLYDLDRVEVLRGPQGTLWGKNTTGGAVHFVSRKPRFERDGYARIDAGSYGRLLFEGAYGGALNDRVATRVSYYNEQSDGWAKNLVSGDTEPKLRDTAARAQIFAQIGDNVDLLFGVSTRTLVGGNNPSYPQGINAGGADNAGFIPGYGTDPRIGDDFYRGQTNGHNRTDQYTATLNWALGDYTLTAIGSYLTAEVRSNTGVGVPPAPRPPSQKVSYGTTDYYQASQELRLTSPSGGRVEWIVGYSWFKQYFGVVAATATLNPSARTAYAWNTLDEQAHSQALFGSFNWHATSRLDLQLGLRYTIEDKDVDETQLRSGAAGSVRFVNPSEWWRRDSVQPATGSPALTQYRLSAEDDWNQLTWDATATFRINDRARVYFRYARGFRSGNFNPTITTYDGTPIIAATQPEILTDYEIGVKSEWLEGRLTANAGLFRYDLENAQLNVQTPNPLGIPNQTTSIIRNAANGVVDGIEFELRARPVDRLTFGANLGLLRSEYRDFVTYQGATPLDASGNEFYRTPKRTLSIDAEYRHPLSSDAELFVNTDWNYRGHYFHNAVIQNDPAQETDGYTLGNVRVGYRSPDRTFDVALYATNVLDTSYRILAQVPNDGAYSVSLGQPRVVGVSFRTRF